MHRKLSLGNLLSRHGWTMTLHQLVSMLVKLKLDRSQHRELHQVGCLCEFYEEDRGEGRVYFHSAPVHGEDAHAPAHYGRPAHRTPHRLVLTCIVGTQALPVQPKPPFSHPQYASTISPLMPR